MVTHPASGLAQDRESSLAETSVLNNMLKEGRRLLLIWRPLAINGADLVTCGVLNIARFSKNRNFWRSQDLRNGTR